MRKGIYWIFYLFSVLTLSACFNSRDELFEISVVEGEFTYQGDSIPFLYNEITAFSLTLSETDMVKEIEDEYDVNEFGDYSSNEIKVYTILLEVEYDNQTHISEVTFIGIANPQRYDAYRIQITLPDYSDQNKEYYAILDFNNKTNKENGLEMINVQLKDNYSQTDSATFDIILNDD